MDPNQEAEIKLLLGDYGWLMLVAIVLFLSRKVIENVVMGFLWKRGIALDDIYYISGRKARLVRVDLTKTTFYMEDRQTKMVVPNEQLKELVVESQLPEGPLEIKVRRSERAPED
jgi:hypothetical protein